MATTNSFKSLAKKVSASVYNFIKNVINYIAPFFRGFWIFIFIATVVIASQVVLRFDPNVGVYINAGALATLIGLALWKEKTTMLATSAAIIPVANMISLSLPQTSIFSQTVIYYDVILVLALVYRFTFTLDEPLSITKLSLKGYVLLLPLMIFLGEALGGIGYIMLRHAYPFGHTSLPLVAGTVAVFALAEESLFRGLIQQRAGQVMSSKLAAILAAALFIATTIGHFSILAPIFAAILVTVLSITYYKKPNLVLSGTINLLTKLTYIGLMASFIFRS
jgi:membrane protease YdiL (CAAX protease family)